MKKLTIKNLDIDITGLGDDDYYSLTNLAKLIDKENPRFVVQNWIRSKSTIEYIGYWEIMNNKNFNRVEFEAVKNSAGSHSFVLTPEKWVKKTEAIGIFSKSGKYYGGTYAHKDIALEFATWISPEIKFLCIKELRRLKEEENKRLDWAGKRQLSSLNYLLQTDAIKKNIIQIDLKPQQISFIYASEADVINVALFGVTANEWKKANTNLGGNIRDFANVIELTILSSLELLNSKLIEKEISQSDRLVLLNEEANKEKLLFTSYKPKLL